jgi:hypothetical protein
VTLKIEGIAILTFGLLWSQFGYATELQTIHLDRGDAGRISLPMQSNPLSQPIEGIRQIVEAPPDVYIQSDSEMGPFDVHPGSYVYFTVHYVVPLRATPGQKSIKVRYEADSDLLEAPESNFLLSVSSIVVSSSIYDSSSVKGFSFRKFVDSDGRKMVAYGPSPEAWIAYDAKRAMSRILQAHAHITADMATISVSTHQRRSLTEQYFALLRLQEEYGIVLSTVSKPNKMYRYPRRTLRAIREAITKSALGFDQKNVRSQIAEVAARKHKLLNDNPNLEDAILGFAGHRSSEANWEKLKAIERKNDSAWKEHSFLLQMARTHDKKMRLSAIRALGNVKEGQAEVAEYLKGLALPPDWHRRAYLQPEHSAAFEALTSLGTFADSAVAEIDNHLPMSSEHVGMEQYLVNILRRIGSRKALELLEVYEREHFRATGLSERAPKGLTGWKGTYSGIRDAQYVLIRSSKEWKDLWGRHSPNSIVPKVDFSKEMVLGMFFGNSHREFLQVAEVNKTGLTYEVLYPDFVASPNYEFLLVRLPRSRAEFTVRQRHRIAMSRSPGPYESVKAVFPRQ